MSVFSKKNKVSLDLQSISTIISEGAAIDGNLKGSSFVRIDGYINGDVTIDEGLILGEKGIIHGLVTTKEIVVYGTINGNLNVESLEIKSTGKISGEIKTHSLSVEAGAIYNGNLLMTKEL
ncbi:MAG: polymer-forming cytoskeletal family protein [Mucilaginibacter sp.]|jgi:cytoskeletal protein CcmA (bactofilin family)|nr:polymer-forming cytoskeletal family protein [Mucilaginibacter sp.]